MNEDYLQQKREVLKQQLADAQVFMERELDDAANTAIGDARRTLDEILFTKDQEHPPQDFGEVLEWRRKRVRRELGF